MSVVAAVTKDLAKLAKRDAALAESALAATALALAAEIDTADNSATSKSLCAKELRETFAILLKLAPPIQQKDDLDDLSARRERRIAGRAAAKP